MTPAQRSKAYYDAHKNDPEWKAKMARKSRERYAKTHIRSEKIPLHARTKHARLDVAIAFAENVSDPRNLGALEHMAWIAWKGWRACEALGSRGPWDLKSGKCWMEFDSIAEADAAARRRPSEK